MFQVLLVPLCVHDAAIVVERDLTVTVVASKTVFGKFAEGLVWRVSNGVADILSKLQGGVLIVTKFMLSDSL